MYLAIDVGGTFIKYGVLDKDGTVIKKDKVKSCNTEEKEFLDLIKRIYEENKSFSIDGICMSVPGLVDVEKGMIVSNGNLKCMIGKSLVTKVSEICDFLPVAVENDGKCAGLAEAWIGAAKNVSNCCVLVFGTSIGGAIIIDKKIYRGLNLFAGELSYLITEPSMNPMNLHQFGIDYSTIGVVSSSKKEMNLDSLTGEEMYKLYLNGNEKMKDIFTNWFFQIACQCYNLQYILDPEIICIGGGISEQPSFIEGIKKSCDMIYNETKQLKKPIIKSCSFNNDSNLIGALYNFLQKYEMK